MLFPSLYDRLERARWNFKDIDFNAIDRRKVDSEITHDIKHISLTELGAVPAARMFMRDFSHDMDFQRFLGIWSFEEAKHSLVLERWLAVQGVEIPQAEMDQININFEPAPWIETLTMHFLGEQRLGTWYGAFSGIAPGAKEHPMEEPVLRFILARMAEDEWRHAACYFTFLKEAANKEPASLENIGKMTLWMLRGPYRHPTNITTPSLMDQLPDPGYFAHLIDRYVTDEARQVLEARIMRCYSILANQEIKTPRELARFLRNRFGAKSHEEVASLV